MNKKLILFFLFSLLILNCLNAQTTKDQEYQEKINEKQEVFDRIDNYLKNNPDVPQRDEYNFKLGRLAIELMEGQPGKIADYFKKVIEINPDFSSIDYARLKYAYYQYEALKKRISDRRVNNLNESSNWPDELRINEDKVQDILESLKKVYDKKNSQYYTEAAYRLGIIYYEIGLDARVPKEYFEKALVYFTKLESADDDSFQVNSTFMHGIINYQLGNYENALNDFMEVLKFLKSTNNKAFISYFESNAILQISHSILTYDSFFNENSLAAQKALSILAQITDKTYGKEIMLKAISLKKKFNAYMQAVDFYNSLITLYPTDFENPVYIDSIIYIYKNNADRVRAYPDAQSAIISQWNRIVDNYNTDSDWYRTNQDSLDLSKRPIKIIRNAYENLEPRYYDSGFDSPKLKNYDSYVDLCENYLKFKSFNDAQGDNFKKNYLKRKSEIAYRLADKYNSLGFYEIARNNFYDYNEKYPENEVYNDFFVNYYSATLEMYNQFYGNSENDTDSLTQKKYTPELVDSLFLQASRNYEDYISDKPERKSERIQVVFKRNEHYTMKEELMKAIEELKKIIVLEPSLQMKKDSYQLIAEKYDELEDYVNSEKYFDLAAELASGNEKEALKNNKVAVLQKKSTNLLSGKDYEKAAQEFLRLKDLDKENEIAYYNKAIEAYESINENQKIINLYLEMIPKLDTKAKKLAAFKNAWEIAENMNDYEQSEDIKKDFIALYPSSNESFKVWLSIIANYKNVEAIKDEEKAAHLYMFLYNKKADLDLGELTPDVLILNAIGLHQKLGNEAKEMQLRIQFEKDFPNHENAIPGLKKVALYYRNQGNEEKFEELANYLYQKDNSIDWYKNIAKQDLMNALSVADSLFEEKDKAALANQRKKYSELVNYYRSNNVKDLPYDLGFKRFEKFDSYFDFHKRFKEHKKLLYDRYLNKNMQQLIWVYSKTTFEEYLFGSGKRIPYLSNRVSNDSEKMIDLIKEGTSDPDLYKLSTKDKTEALYIAGRVNEYVAETITKQIQKYFRVANEIKVYKKNPDNFKKVQSIVISKAKKYRLENLKKAYIYYRSLYSQYDQNTYYTDEYTQKAYLKLVEKRIEPEISVDSYTSVDDWKISTGFADSLITKNFSNEKFWKNPNYVLLTDSLKFTNIEKMIKLEENSKFLGRSFEIKAEPQKVELFFYTKQDLIVKANDNVISPDKYTIIAENENNKLIYVNIDKTLLKKNFKLILINNSLEEINAAVELRLTYLKKDLAVANVSNPVEVGAKEKTEVQESKKNELISDYTWYGSTKDIDYNDFEFKQEEWQFVGKSKSGDTDYSIENSKALPIWSETNSKEVTFYKKIDVNKEVVANLILKAPKVKGIWINNNKIEYDGNLTRIVKKDIKLLNGQNEIIINVESTKDNDKYLLFSLKYNEKR